MPMRPLRACVPAANPDTASRRAASMGQQTMAKRSISARVIEAVRGFGLAALFAAPLAAAAAGGAAAQDNKAMVLKLATATLNDAQHEWLKRFAAKIEKATNGRM